MDFISWIGFYFIQVSNGFEDKDLVFHELDGHWMSWLHKGSMDDKLLNMLGLTCGLWTIEPLVENEICF